MRPGTKTFAHVPRSPNVVPLQPDLIKFADLTKMLGMSRPTLDKLATQPGFPHKLRIANRFVISESAVRQWLARKLGESTDI